MSKEKYREKFHTLRSQEVQEIISRKSGFFTNWTLIIFSLILILFISISFFIPYPQIIETNGSLNGFSDPIKVFANQNTRLEKVCVRNGDRVSAGQVLCWLQDSADHEKILSLLACADSVKEWLSKGFYVKVNQSLRMDFGDLGDVRIYYEGLVRCWKRIGFYSTKKPKDKCWMLVEKVKGKDRDLEISDFNKSLRIFKVKTLEWIKKYTIEAPQSGIIDFAIPLQQRIFLFADTVIAYILPEYNMNYVKLHLSQPNLGRVKIGQMVELRFDAYPFQEFGSVKGELKFIANSSEGNDFIAYVHLPDGLKTNYKRDLQYRSGLMCKALIVTKDLNLFQQLFHNVFGLR